MAGESKVLLELYLEEVTALPDLPEAGVVQLVGYDDGAQKLLVGRDSAGANILTSAPQLRLEATGRLRATGEELGAELVTSGFVATRFAARRRRKGNGGTTTIELFKNGVTTGLTLSWTSADADEAVKASVISLALTQDDRVSFKITSAEASARDILATVI